MGCRQSKAARKPRVSVKNTRAIIRPPAGVPASNFYIRNKTKCTEIRAPGSLYMQSFEISACNNCTFYICDATAATYIMGCTGCNIVIGPTEATISVKDCRNCKFILCSRDIRATNTVECEFLIYCFDKPTLEKCSKLKFGCYDFSYFEFAKQMEMCRLPLWENRWSEIINYTGGDSWEYLPLDTKATTFVPALTPEQRDLIKFQPELRIVPRTYGLTRPKNEEAVNQYFIAFMPSAATSSGLQFTDQFQDTKFEPPLYLIRTSYQTFCEEDAKKVFNRKPYIIAQCTKGGTAMLHFIGNNAKEQITELLKSQRVPEQAYYLSPNYETSTKQIALVWKD